MSCVLEKHWKIPLMAFTLWPEHMLTCVMNSRIECKCYKYSRAWYIKIILFLVQAWSVYTPASYNTRQASVKTQWYGSTITVLMETHRTVHMIHGGWEGRGITTTFYLLPSEECEGRWVHTACTFILNSIEHIQHIQQSGAPVCSPQCRLGHLS